MSLRVPTADLLRWIADTRALLDRLERGLAPQETSGETIDLWFERWNADRSKRGHDADHEQLTYRRWIRPRLGELRVTGQLRGPVDDWVHWIEGRVEEGALHSTTAWRVWTVLAAMLRDMYAARNRALRVRVDNPAPDVRGPPRGTPRVGTFLYPSEFLRLVSCARVSLGERRLYAVAIYLWSAGTTRRGGAGWTWRRSLGDSSTSGRVGRGADAEAAPSRGPRRP